MEIYPKIKHKFADDSIWTIEKISENTWSLDVADNHIVLSGEEVDILCDMIDSAIRMQDE